MFWLYKIYDFDQMLNMRQKMFLKPRKKCSDVIIINIKKALMKMTRPTPTNRFHFRKLLDEVFDYRKKLKSKIDFVEIK